MKRLLDSRGLRPKRSLGQNFLIDQNLVRKVVDAGDVQPGDCVLEVGPGTGTLTEELLARGASVIACELDDGLAELLRERVPALPGIGPGRFTLMHGDCLESKHRLAPALAAALPDGPFKLVANLPYGAATPLLLTLLIDHPACSIMCVTVQRELADRLLAHPDSKDFGPLGVVAQAVADVRRIATAPPECFWPRPDVTSTIVRIARLATPLTSDARRLSDFCRVLFAHRRKQIGATLRTGAASPIDWARVQAVPGLSRVEPTHRAEQLTVAEIIGLADAFENQGVRFPHPGEAD